MNPYVSIIVPIYKVEPYLHQCIDSILGQTFKDFELILVDDGSPDKCPKICDEYEKMDSRITVIHKPNGGHVSARNAGFNISKGEYIGFVDSDDWIESDMYENLCKTAKAYDVDIVICDLISDYYNTETKLKQPIKKGYHNKKALVNDIYPFMLYSGSFYEFGISPSLSNKIFKRKILENNLYNVSEVIKIGEDAACTYPALLDANSIYILENKYLYHYRQIPSSITRRYDPNYFERTLVLYRLLKEINKEKQVYDITEQLNYYLTMLIMNVINNEISETNVKSYHEKLKFLKYVTTNNEVKQALTKIRVATSSSKLKTYIWLLKRKKIASLYFVLTIKRKVRNMCFQVQAGLN